MPNNSARTKLRDPEIRADGKCAVCKRPRLTHLPKVLTQISRAELLKNLAGDPFCRSECCRKYHGTQLKLNTYEQAHARGRERDFDLALA